MQKFQYLNPKGQEVGLVENNIYKTARCNHKKEIFRHKKYFNGVYINNAVAIQKSILDDLLRKNVEWVEFTIIGIERISFRKYIKTSLIKNHGVLMCFDKGNSTNWGQQYVFSYDWGIDKIPEDLMQWI